MRTRSASPLLRRKSTVKPDTTLCCCQAHNKFYEQVYAAVERHFDLDALKVLIIASPGFVKEAVHQHIMDEAVRRGNKSILGARQKFLLLHSPSHHVHSLAQILSSAEVRSARLAAVKWRR